jgi:hypothetical protein
MKKNKILIQIFPLVTDIDLLERSLFLLKQSSLHIDKDKFHIILDVTLPLTDYLVDWDKSIIKKDYFINKFNHLKTYGNWADECYFNITDDIKGCVDYCITNVYKYKDVNDVIWLDSDILFNQYTLGIFLESSLEIKKQRSKYIITPECVKLWDSSWDVLVNENFIDKPFNYVEKHDPIIDSSKIYGDISLELVNLKNERTFKFGGGWFTMLSKELLDYFEFPTDAKGYSPIDTYVMEFCKHIPEAIQYKIKNLVVCEDKTYIDNTLYKNYVNNINRKQDDYIDTWGKLIKSGDEVINKNKNKRN